MAQGQQFYPLDSHPGLCAQKTMHHLFVDISSHGFGHLAQTAPVLHALRQLIPSLRLTIRCGLPEDKLRARIRHKFTLITDTSDFGFVMHDAVRINHEATAQRYCQFHANWTQRVTDEARLLTALRPDLVLTDVAYLPLAGATLSGLPSFSMCSLNWADLFIHFFGHEPWAPPIHKEILTAYRSAERFLRLTPSMPMPELPNAKSLAPIAALGARRRTELHHKLGIDDTIRTVLIAYGGIDKELRTENWPCTPGIRWLVPQRWRINRSDMTAIEPLGFDFTDLLSSVDAVLTKPGYGTFAEAACNGTAILYQRRDDWPEQEPLIRWLRQNARCLEVGIAELSSGDLGDVLDKLWQQPAPRLPSPRGATEAACLLQRRLTTEN